MQQTEDDSSALFGERFLDKYAGNIIEDPETAIVELVANAWDAHATRVDIVWPTATRRFSISDNGEGMTAAEFNRRWRMLDYERLKEQGKTTSPPPSLADETPRQVYGRNGKGRHAAFYFGNPYTIITTKNGVANSFSVSRSSGTERPFDIERLSDEVTANGHGTKIIGHTADALIPPSYARQIIGSRFLIDPNFRVFVDGIEVTFEDIRDEAIRKTSVEVPPYGTAQVLMIDAQKTDRSTRQHGIAWWVNKRLVGACRWRGKDLMTVIDGRTSEAKRFTFIVFADFLEDTIKEDWSDFQSKNEKWQNTREIVVDHIRDLFLSSISERRSSAKNTVIPTRNDHDLWAHCRIPMDMMRHG